MKKKTLILVVWFLACQSSAQVLPFHHYTIGQGLASNDVTALCQDSKGYLWIGTGDGISVFDGTSIRNLTSADGLALNNVASIAESHHIPGTMIIGTWGGGISRLNGEVFTTLFPDSTTDGRTIIDAQEDYQGILWSITYSGAYRLLDGKFVYIPDTKDAGAVLVGRDRSVWIGNGRAIMIYSPGRTEITDKIELPSRGDVTLMHQDKLGSIWVATSDSLLIHVVDRKPIAHRRISFGRVTGIADDANANLWLGTSNGLLSIAIDRAFSSSPIRSSTENGLLSNSITSCYMDHEDNLWIGGNGLSRLSDRNFSSFPLAGLQETYNNSKAITDNRGHIWTITNSGIVETWKDQTGQWLTHLHHFSFGSGGSSLCITRDNTSRIWIDTRKRIECYEIESSSTGHSSLVLKHVFESGTTLPNGSRFFFIVDSKMNIWMSVIGNGAYKVNPWVEPVAVKAFSTANGLPSNDIRAIYEDRTGNIWFGTVAEGLVVITPHGDSVLSRYAARDGLPDELIRAVAQDNDGKMWIGTRRNGITVGSNGDFRKISVENNLLGSAVWALAADDTSNLMWVGTSLGVQRINMNTFLPVRSNHILTGKAAGSLGTYRGQFLWYVTSDALTVYEYSSGTLNASPPRTHITRFTVNARNVDTRSLLEFKHDENLVTCEYIGITFRETDAVRYQCRLLGAESDWQSATTQRTVTYASLAPGSYTFEVRAINADGVMNDTASRLSFVIIPPFWVHWWFIGLCSSLLVGIVVVVVRVRVQRLLEIERLRSRIARDLHDEIGSNLSSIAMASNLLGRHPELGEMERSKLSDISSVALNTVKDMKDIVWLINPGNDSLDELFLRMKDTAAALLEGCHLTLNFPATANGMRVNLEWKRNVYFIYKETLTNILKHSSATDVTVDVRVENNHLLLKIQDNGKGFNIHTVRRGNGLKNIQERAGLLHATLDINGGSGEREYHYAKGENNVNA